MRRTKTQMVCAADKALNVFKNLNIEKGYDIRGEFKRETYAEFYDYSNDEKCPELVCVGIPLATFYNVRGFSANDFDYLFFDEITPEALEKVSTKEESAFLNVIESMNRNRELSGKKPIQIILAGNADRLNCPILRSLNLVKTVENMINAGREEYIDAKRGVAVYWLVNSPIAQKKEQTFLYQTTKNKDFKRMALDNRFKDFEISKRCLKNFPPEQLMPLYSINNQFFVYKIKSNNFYFVGTQNYSVKKNYNLYLTSEKKRFIISEKVSVEKVIVQQMFYQDFDTKSQFETLIFQ